jgi:hypothetical protein
VSTLLSWVALWALGFVRASVRTRNGGCGSGSSLTMMSSLINNSKLPSRGSSKSKKGSPVEPNTGGHLTRPAHASISMLQNHGIACVNLTTITIESSAQRDQLLPMTIVQHQSGRGLTCINESTRAFGWVISGPYPLTSSAGQLAKCPDQPPLLPEAWV